MPISSRSPKKSITAKKSGPRIKRTGKTPRARDGVSKKTRQEIKQATHTLEQMIKDQYIQELNNTLPPNPPSEVHPLNDHISDEASSKTLAKRKLLLIGVVSFFSVAIVGLWSVQMKTMLYDVSRQESNVGSLVDIAKDDFSQVVDSLIEVDTSRQAITDSLVLAANAQQTATASSTTTTPPSPLLDKLITAIQQTSSTSSTTTSTP